MVPRKYFKYIYLCLLIFFSIGILIFGTSCYVVHDDILGKAEEKKGLSIYFEARTFNAKKYVDDIWESKILPYADQHAVPLGKVINALKEDEQKACTTYGFRAIPEHQNPYNFIVKGEGVVLEVHTKSRNGTIDIDINPSDGHPDAIIQIGPVFTGEAIRDSMEFIHFGDFTNQLDWAKLSDELNSRVHTNVLAGIDPAKLKGAHISFEGCFSHHLGATDEKIIIAPVRFTVK